MSNDRLKFRAWDETLRRMMPWEEVRPMFGWCLSYHKVMQWTGLYDSEGVMIFEGDVVRVETPFGTSGKHPKNIGPTLPVIGEVKFIAPEFFYREPKWQQEERVRQGNATDWYRGQPVLSESVVIGNVYESPGILEMGNS